MINPELERIDAQIAELQRRKAAITGGFCYMGPLPKVPADPYNLTATKMDFVTNAIDNFGPDVNEGS